MQNTISAESPLLSTLDDCSYPQSSNLCIPHRNAFPSILRNSCAIFHMKQMRQMSMEIKYLLHAHKTGSAQLMIDISSYCFNCHIIG